MSTTETDTGGTAGRAGEMADLGREAAGQGMDKAREAAGQGMDKAREVTGQGMEKAREAAGQARGKMTQQLDERSTRAGEQATAVADASRKVASELRGQGQESTAKLVERAADGAQRVGDYLHRADGDTLVRDVESMARKRPWVVVAGGFALGLAAARFMKASAQRRSDGQDGGQREWSESGTAATSAGEAVGAGTTPAPPYGAPPQTYYGEGSR